VSGFRKRDREAQGRERQMPKRAQSPGALEAFREAQRQIQASRDAARVRATDSEGGEVSE
jgi:hypothetical protein